MDKMTKIVIGPNPDGCSSLPLLSPATPSLKLRFFAPEKCWLEDDPFLLGFSLFSRVNLLLVLGRVMYTYRIHGTGIFMHSYQHLPSKSTIIHVGRVATL